MAIADLEQAAPSAGAFLPFSKPGVHGLRRAALQALADALHDDLVAGAPISQAVPVADGFSAATSPAGRSVFVVLR